MFLGGGGTKNAGLKYAAAGWMDSMMITAGAAAALYPDLSHGNGVATTHLAPALIIQTLLISALALYHQHCTVGQFQGQGPTHSCTALWTCFWGEGSLRNWFHYLLK